MLSCALVVFTGCRKGLYKAVDVLREEGAVAPSMVLMSPVNAESPLGTSVRRSPDADVIELAAERCFWLTATEPRSLNRVTFQDGTTRSLEVLLGVKNIADAGLKFKRSSATKGTFTDVKVVSGTGVFDPNRCSAKPGQRFQIVTGAISGVLDVVASLSLEVAPKASVTIPNTPVDVTVENGTANSRQARFTATEPVYFAAVSSWVTVETSSTKDEPIPATGVKSVAFPPGFSGSVVLKGFDSGNLQAHLTISPDNSVAGTASAESVAGTACTLRADTNLTVGSSCQIWLGNASIIVKVFMTDSYPMIRLDAYRTNLSP